MSDLEILSSLLKRIERLERRVKVLEGEPKLFKFEPPTIDQVREYCKERGNKVDPQQFIDFYESKGWFVGKNKMKDWKSSCRTWEKREGNTLFQKHEATGRAEKDEITPDYGIPSKTAMTREEYLASKNK